MFSPCFFLFLLTTFLPKRSADRDRNWRKDDSCLKGFEVKFQRDLLTGFGGEGHFATCIIDGLTNKQPIIQSLPIGHLVRAALR